MREFDIQRFIRDKSLRTAEPGDKHYRSGWVNVPCPFCVGSPGFHLGFYIPKSYWNCYRCGWHNQTEVVKDLLNVSWEEAKRVAVQYGGRPVSAKEAPLKDTPSKIVFPRGTDVLGSRHRRYLFERGFDPDILAEEWGILGTGPSGPYKFRIIVPIHLNNKVVSYQGRDITDASPFKYKACPMEQEVVSHRNVLYGIDNVRSHTVLVTEGVTDVWRLGPGAVATFGVEWSIAQASRLKDFPRVCILYDAERQAQKRAEALGGVIAGFGSDVLILQTPFDKPDPGSLTDVEAREFMRAHVGIDK